MTISKRVQSELMLHLVDHEPPTLISPQSDVNKGKTWTSDEHERFLVALQMYPSGPWKAIAAYVGTKTVRQTTTHAQKYREKMQRRQRGLRRSIARTKKRKTQCADESPVQSDACLDVLDDMDAVVLSDDEWELPELPLAFGDVEPIPSSPALSSLADDVELLNLIAETLLDDHECDNIQSTTCEEAFVDKWFEYLDL